MNPIIKFSGVVALVILAILGISGFFGQKPEKTNVFGSTSCGGITCLSGGLRLVADAGGDFESDVAAVFNSTFTSTSNVTTGHLVQGGGMTSTTSPASAVLTADAFNAEIGLTVNLSVGSITYTFPPASSSVYQSWGLSAGSCMHGIFVNATTTANQRLTIATGTNIPMFNISSTSAVLPPSVGNATSTAQFDLCETGTTAIPNYIINLYMPF